MEMDRNGLEVLGRAECVRLLATRRVARIGVSCGALPTILPVNYVVAGHEVLFRTHVGSALDTATRDAVVAFETDDIDDERRTGWSVVVVGVAGERQPDDVDPAALGRLDPWLPRAGSRLVAISLDRVTGRRLVVRAGSVPVRTGRAVGDGG